MIEMRFRNTESFVFYESFYKTYNTIKSRVNEKMAYHLLDCIIEFGLYGVVPDESDDVWLYGFEQCITSISNAKTKREIAIENGKKGGRKERYSPQEVLQLKERGLTNKQIANQLGYSTETVRLKLLKAEEENFLKSCTKDGDENESINSL